VANGFDSVPVGIQDERGIVVRVVLRPYAGLAIVSSASIECSGIEASHRFPVGCAEAHVHARQGRHAYLARDRELHPELSRHRAVVRAAVLEINGTDETKGSQSRVVESTAALQVSHAQ